MNQISIHKLGDKEYGLLTVPKDAHSFYLLDAANKDNVQGTKTYDTFIQWIYHRKEFKKWLKQNKE